MSNPKLVSSEKARRVTVLGDEVLIRLSTADTNGVLSLFEQRTKPGGGVPMHVHEREDETFQLLEGSVRFTIGGKHTQSFVAHAGDSVWGPRGIPHAWEAVGSGPVRLLIATTPSGMEKMFEELNTLPAGPPDFAKVREICGRHGVSFL